MMSRKSVVRAFAFAAIASSWAGVGAIAQEGPPGGGDKPKPDFPPFAEVSKDFEKVVSTTEGESLYTIWKRDKDGQLLAELPRNYAGQKHFFAMTVASGDTWAGLQGDDMLVYWKRFDKTLALIQPNMATRTTGDEESRSGVAQQFSDRVLLDLPIVCMGPGGQPVIDLDALLCGQIGKFFGGQGGGANPKLATIKEAKAFPENIEISIEMPAAGGMLKTFHYSISRLPENTGYKPRDADERLGFFTTSFVDLGKFRDDQKWVRYINRWHLEKRDPSLKLSPPKKPIVFYIDQTVPVRYRRYIRQGIEYWNKAYERVGLVNAIEVEFQDKATGAHMDKDPEDVRYNFIRWLSNDQGTAIGPSRVDPKTGQILDADVVLTDGWIRHFWFQANTLLPDLATQSFSAETMAWLDQHPQWDPRIRLADPAERDWLIAQRSARGVMRYGGHPAANIGTSLYGDDEFDGLVGRTSQFNGLCMAARGKGMDMALMRMNIEIIQMLEEEDEPEPAKGDKAAAAAPQAEPPKEGDKADEPKKEEGKKEKEDLIDGIPEWFVGPMLADLVAHEVGHTLGLRHNFKASSIYKLSEINSDAIKGKKPFAGSVMDYIPVNINREAGPVQGDYAMTDIGPYDLWVIEYGYTMGDPKKVLERVSEAELCYLTDEDVGGPDPLAARYDFSADPLDYANNQMRLIDYYRARLTTKFVKDGDSWAKARRGYEITLGQQMQALSMMSPWVGGAHINRDKKGDPNARPPIQVVPAQTQRAALRFVVDHSFKDESFGLTPDMLKFMTVDKWLDGGGMRDAMQDATFPVHDRIIGIQASALTMILNPTTLKRVYDNEFRVPSDQDMLTLPEVINTVSAAVWGEVDSKPGRAFDVRQPMVSSLRRNLQREHLDRMIGLTEPGSLRGAAAKPIANLSTMKLRDIRAKIKTIIEGDAKGKVDEYTLAHLSEAALRIDKALDAIYIYNTDKIGGGGGGFPFTFGRSPAEPASEPAFGPPADY